MSKWGSRGIALSQEFFDNGVGDEREEIGLNMGLPDVRVGGDNSIQDTVEGLFGASKCCGEHGNI